jgi:PKD repeat protein
VDNDHQSPEHTYTTAAKRTVILATTNAFGFASETKVDYITVLFKARMHSAMMQSDGLRFT